MMNYDQCVASLSMPLPEDIEKRKWSGDLSGAIAAIDLQLQEEIPDMLRCRLQVERERLLRLPTQYPWNRTEAIAQLQKLVPDVTEEEFDRLELIGRIDFILVDGEKRYFVRFARTLVKCPELMARTGYQPNPASPYLDPMIATIREKGSLTYRLTLDASIGITDSAFKSGQYQAWLPFPAVCAQQSDIVLESGIPDYISAEDAPARTAHFTRQLNANERFAIRYSYTSRIVYADPLHKPAPAQPLYPAAAPVSDADLAEDGTFILFTPYLRALEATLSANAASPAEKAWRYYEFVTTKVKYSFMRDYFQIDHLGEYCAINRKGDCGLQALLFIILCRIGGIPARWQSGMSIDSDGSAGSHDWAQFWLEGWGWLFADCSYGGSAYRAGNSVRHAFYFGNLDPKRMVANRLYMAPFDPPMAGFRFDPYDNQGGEVLLEGAERFFNGRELDEDAVLVSATEI